MGLSLSQTSLLDDGLKSSEAKPLLAEIQIFATWTLVEVRHLWKLFKLQVIGYSLVEVQLESILSFCGRLLEFMSVKELFQILDNDNDGRVDGLEILSALCLISKAEFTEKARFCFELFDFNMNSSLSENELAMMLTSVLSGLNIFIGGDMNSEPTLDWVEKVTKAAFLSADRDKSRSISLDEFLSWMRSNRDIMSAIEKLDRVVQDARSAVESEDSAPESDDDVGSYTSSQRVHDDKIKPLPEKDESSATSIGLVGDHKLPVGQRLQQLYEPTNFRATKHSTSTPESNLELMWAFGVQCEIGCKNFRYIFEDRPDIATQGPQLIVYPTAALGVVLGWQPRRQRFYRGHSCRISCLSVPDRGHVVVSGDVQSQIHVWDALTLNPFVCIQGVVPCGILSIALSTVGNRLVAIGGDSSHTLAVYDSINGDLIASGRSVGGPGNVTDVAFSPSGEDVVVVGYKSILFYKNVHKSMRVLKATVGKIGSKCGGKRQQFHCVAYCKEDVVVGCASGEIYVFTGCNCSRIVQAHENYLSVLCISFDVSSTTLVTGSADGTVRTWDSTYHAIGAPLDISEGMSAADSSREYGARDVAITSVQMADRRLLVSTRSCNVFEVSVYTAANGLHEQCPLVWGHGVGRISGLAVHPMKDEFATTGEDKTVRVWSLVTYELCGVRALPTAGSAVTFSSTGDQLCVGMCDGSVAVLYEQTLNKAQIRTDTRFRITCIKFSPNNSFLATGSEDSNVYLYRNESGKWIPSSVCSGHESGVTALDFSLNSKYLRSNCHSYSLIYWDVGGNMVQAPSTMRDVVWAQATCPLSWDVKGVWGSVAVTSLNAKPELDVVVVADTSHALNLFRYPCPGCAVDAKVPYLSYRGHAGDVAGVLFTRDNRFVISIGGDDRTILLWRHELQETLSDCDSSEYSEPPHYTLGYDDGYALTVRDDWEYPGVCQPDEGTHVRPWQSAAVAPTDTEGQTGSYLQPAESTDVDLTLQWIHGYSSEGLQNALYTGNGDVVYPAASVVIVYGKARKQQRFLLGVHRGPVTCLAMHPAGLLCATSDGAIDASVAVWNVESCTLISQAQGLHAHGVDHVAFSESGSLLASVGRYPGGKLIVRVWARDQIVYTVPLAQRIYCSCFWQISRSESAVDCLLTSTGADVTFWLSQDMNVKCQRGLISTRLPASSLPGGPSPSTRSDMTLCAASASSGICVTGTSTGSLVIWKDFKELSRCLHSQSSAAVTALWACKGTVADTVTHPLMHMSARYISGTVAGEVVVWAMWALTSAGTLALIPLVSTAASEGVLSTAGMPTVRSICERNGSILVGVSSSKIFEFDMVALDDREIASAAPPPQLKSTGQTATPSTTSTVVSDGKAAVPTLLTTTRSDQSASGAVLFSEPALLASPHAPSDFGLTALALHPSKNVFVTGGDDVHCWSMDSEQNLVSCLGLGYPCSACSFSCPSGEYVALGSTNGRVRIIATSALMMVDAHVTAASASKDFVVSDAAVGVVRYSPDGTLLAVGSCDSYIYLFTVRGASVSACSAVCSGHRGRVQEIDFGSAELEGMSPELVLRSTSSVHELLFWAVQGEHAGSQILSAAAVRDAVWATGSSRFGWATSGIWGLDRAEVRAVDRSHHWREVSVLVTADVAGCVRLYGYPCTAVGAADKRYRGHAGPISSVQFSYDDTYCISIGKDDHCVFVWASGTMLHFILSQRVMPSASDIPEERKARRSLPTTPALPPSSCDPWDSEMDGTLVSGFRDTYLEDHAKGVVAQHWMTVTQGPSHWITKNTVGKLPDAYLDLKFVYGYSGLICPDNVAHGDDVFECIYSAGNVGVVYNTQTHTQLINGEHESDITCLAVHPLGHTVATGSASKIVIWDTNSGVTLGVIPMSNGGVTAVSFSGDGQVLVSVGGDVDRTIAVHTVRTLAVIATGRAGHGVDVRVLLAGTATIVTAGRDHFKFWDLPTSSGGASELSSKQGLFMRGAPSRTTTSLARAGPEVASGMADGLLVLWSGRTSGLVTQAHTGPVTAMRAVVVPRPGPGTTDWRLASAGDDGLVCLWSSTLKKVWEMDLNRTVPTTSPTAVSALSFKEERLLVGTQAGVVLEAYVKTSEVRLLVEGHAPVLSRGAIRVAVHPTKPRFISAGEDSTIRCWDARACRQLYTTSIIPCTPRALAVSADAAVVAVGTEDGHVLVLSEDLVSVLVRVALCVSSVTSLQYDPAGTVLAVGTGLGVYVLDARTYCLRWRSTSHVISVQDMGFSDSGDILQTVCESNVIRYWDTAAGKSLETTCVKDVTWATCSCVVGWSARGPWDRAGSDRSSTADRSLARGLMTSGSRSANMKLFRWPSPSAEAAYRTVTTHANGAVCVRFSVDGNYLYITGYGSNIILQYEVKNIVDR